MCQVIGIFDKDGKCIGSAWQCGCLRLPNGELESMEERWIRTTCEEQHREMEAEMIRDATALHDPNRCDSRNVRREFHEPHIINLGSRVDRIPSRLRRLERVW